MAKSRGTENLIYGWETVSDALLLRPKTANLELWTRAEVVVVVVAGGISTFCPLSRLTSINHLLAPQVLNAVYIMPSSPCMAGEEVCGGLDYSYHNPLPTRTRAAHDFGSGTECLMV